MQIQIPTLELTRPNSHFAITTALVCFNMKYLLSLRTSDFLGMAEGREHESSTGNFAGPSYCTLPIFHPPPIESGISEISQHVSNDGHRFNCPDPATLIPIFHVIFVLDR